MPPKSNPDDDELKRKFVESQEREQRQREERRQREEERERRRLEEEQRLQEAGAGAGAVVIDDALMSRLETIFMQLDARNAKRQADQERVFAERLLAMESRIRSEVGNAKREADESVEDRAVFEARVPATTVPPPKLAFVGLDAVDFESWKDRWNAYLENAGVEGIRDLHARDRRKRGLLTQALDDAGQAWVREQGWGDKVADDVIKAIEDKLAAEADPRTQLVGLMSRMWLRGEQVDAFWLDIQRKARYCGFCGDCGDKLLAAIWAKNFVEPATQADLNKDPKLKAAECYRIAKGFENARLNAEKWAKEAANKPEVIEVNRMQASTYRRQHQGPAARPTPPTCSRCGTSHPPRTCPAYGRKCNRCGKTGHFEKCCRGAATVNNVMINALGYEPEDDNARGAAATTWSPEDRLRDEMAFRGMSR
jgi:hypothetical protein